MAHVRRESEMNLSDYFCRGGFGDGDDRIAMDAGFDYLEYACEILNGIMEAKGLEGWRAEQEDVSSIHNTLFIHIVRDNPTTKREDELPVSSDWSDSPPELETVSEDHPLYKEFSLFRDKVWVHAFNELEKLIEQREKSRASK